MSHVEMSYLDGQNYGSFNEEECPECGGMDIFVCGTCQREVRDSRYTVTVSHDFKILRSHLLEELEAEVAHHLSGGWQLTGNLHHVGYVDGTIEYMWGVVRKEEKGDKY